LTPRCYCGKGRGSPKSRRRFKADWGCFSVPHQLAHCAVHFRHFERGNTQAIRAGCTCCAALGLAARFVVVGAFRLEDGVLVGVLSLKRKTEEWVWLRKPPLRRGIGQTHGGQTRGITERSCGWAWERIPELSRHLQTARPEPGPRFVFRALLFALSCRWQETAGRGDPCRWGLRLN
jgi:hypothetical protein